MGNFMKKLTWTHKSLILRMLSILLTCIAVISVSSLGASGQTVGKKITIDKKTLLSGKLFTSCVSKAV